MSNTPSAQVDQEQIARTHECDVCGGFLFVKPDSEGKDQVVCAADETHKGIRPTRKLMDTNKFGGNQLEYAMNSAQAMRQLAKRVVQEVERNLPMPKGPVPEAEAAHYLIDCAKLGIDPFLGDAYAVPYWNEKAKVYSLVTTMSYTGWISIAQRGSADRWAGPPDVKLVTEEALKEAIAGSKSAIVWVAKGKLRMPDGLIIESGETYGWANDKNQPNAMTVGKGNTPGNQARVRAISRWVQENFPDARSRIQGLRGSLMERAAGIAEAARIIDGEYRELDASTNAALPPGQRPAVGAKSTPTKQPKPWPAIPFKNLGEVFNFAQLEYGYSKRYIMDQMGVSDDLAISNPEQVKGYVEEIWKRQHGI